jgi:hypothetical protein
MHDAVSPHPAHPEAEFSTVPVPQGDRADPVVGDGDIRAIAEQLGRPVRGIVAVAARCVCGAPLVAMTAPRLPGGAPFPTLYYLTHPVANRALRRLESEGLMAAMNLQLRQDATVAAAYRRAHGAYLADRERLGRVSEIEGVSAGGMPDRVKCLHALAAHALAAGPGVNPFGDQALVAVADRWRPDSCACRTASRPEGQAHPNGSGGQSVPGETASRPEAQAQPNGSGDRSGPGGTASRVGERPGAGANQGGPGARRG